ncbi:alpha/beta fold hydrolase [Streptomyces sp. 8N706]|uniref:alpha/beta fold hydrolase n=1 Tax=Streptomyces sp. 8N706 TaxID=3457416 RepID=UPI003FD255EB
MTVPFFPGFDAFRCETAGVTINGVIGGSGPPLLLLHGWPQTHVVWHRVAPLLAPHFTVVATDLRGYGDSGKPADGQGHDGHSKRAMAHDQVGVMTSLGFDRFAVVGHDRGGRVGHRMALDHPDVVSKLAVLDIVPTRRLYAEVSKELASVYFHWFFLIQPAPLPETLLAGNAEFFLRNWAFRGYVPSVVTEAAFAEYLRCFTDPATLHAMCEDYRAAATIDLDHDATDHGVGVRCPVLALWGAQGAMGALYDVLDAWKEYASDVQGEPLPGGHWLPEEQPGELVAELRAFLA